MELIILPFIFALIALITPKALMRAFTLVAAAASVVLVLIHACYYYGSDHLVQIFQSNSNSFGFSLNFAYDGISLLMLVLVNVTIALIALANFKSTLAEDRKFVSMLFLMQFALIGVFTAFDGLLFYIFWEITLIPVFLIALWFGAAERKKILIKFFIFTFVGSLAMLLALIGIKQWANSFSYIDLVLANLPIDVAFYVMGGFFIAFAIKIPLIPFHTWQPDTYTVAPTAGTMLLSALMLKMALYGMIRWMIPLAPEALSQFQNPIIYLGIIGVVYTAIIAIRLKDMKRVFAYASISHVGLIAAGIIIFNPDTLGGSLIQMFNHSLVAVGLFLAVEVIERRTQLRDLDQLGGIATQAPKFAFWFAVIGFASVSVPFSSGFIGEFILIKGVYDYNWIWGAIAGLSVILGAVYTLRAYQLSMYGTPKGFDFPDLHWSEWLTFAFISGLVLLLGLYPNLILNFINPSLDQINSLVQSTTLLP